MRRDPPAHDHPGERVDDETHVGDTHPGGYERPLGHPEPVRSGRGELPPHTRSGCRADAGCDLVVFTRFERRAPSIPAARINRAV